MNRYIIVVIYCTFYFSPFFSFGQYNLGQNNQSQNTFIYKELNTPSPSAESKALFRFLQNISGEKVLSGQMTNHQGIDELEYINNVTAKKPAILGFEFENETVIQDITEWWNNGGIPLISWHWGAPTFVDNRENSTKEISIEKCLQEGTQEYISFWNTLEAKANHLEKLRDANVPVLWYPFPEQNGNLFWWGKQGPDQFIKLWQTMFNYFTNDRKLNNLIWVTGFSQEVDFDWFPGNSYVDIVGAGSYEADTNPLKELYIQAKAITNNNMAPVAYSECTMIPDPEQYRKNDAIWSWWMQRPESFLTNIDQSYLTKVYHHDLVITLDELPDFVKDFNDETVKRYYYSATTLSFDDFKGFNIGTKPPNVKVNDKQIEIQANGDGFRGKKDKGFFTFEQIEGDFDVSVKIPELTSVHLNSMAGIMARSDLGKKSSHVFFHVFSNNNQSSKNHGGCELTFRNKASKQTQTIHPHPKSSNNSFDINFPNTWIRLKRRGNIFKSYISNDNINWRVYSVHKQEMPEKLLVGLAASSGSEDLFTTVKFENFEITWE